MDKQVSMTVGAMGDGELCEALGMRLFQWFWRHFTPWH